MQYTWKGGPRFEAPLLAADRLVHNGGARDERRGGGGGGKGRPGVGSLANDNQHPISADGGQKPSLNGSSKGTRYMYIHVHVHVTKVYTLYIQSCISVIAYNIM